MIDKNKTYRTRDGREVRIYSVDGAGRYCVHGAVKTVDGWEMHLWAVDGRTSHRFESPLDIIEVKARIKREYWMNVYPDALGWSARTKEEADHGCINTGRIACVKIVIDCEEGEGL
jgi:hypothetical protein